MLRWIAILSAFLCGALAQTASDNEMRGRVIDAKGSPIPNAQISVKAVTRATGVRYGATEDVDPNATANEFGEFVVHGKQPFFSVTVTAEAPGFAKGVFSQLTTGGVTNELRLIEGVLLTGRALKNGMPLPNFKIGLSDTERGSAIYYLNLTAETDSEGRFAFSNLPPRRDYFIYSVMNPGGAIVARKVSAGPNATLSDIGDLALEPAFTLSGKLPASNIVVRLGRDGPHDFQQTTSAADGSFRFIGVPAEPITIAAEIPGQRLSMRNASLFPPSPDRLLGRVATNIAGLILDFEPGPTLAPLDIDLFALREEPLRGAEKLQTGRLVEGKILDADTSQLLDTFSIIEGRIRNARTNWFPTHRHEFAKGAYSLHFPEGDGYLLQAEAPNYLPQLIANTATKLKRAAGVHGLVQKPTGEPAPHATVFLADSFTSLIIEGPPFQFSGPFPRTTTDDKGAFSFPPKADEFALFVFDDSGFAFTRIADLPKNPNLKLQPWARVEGRLKIADQLGTNEVIRLVSRPRPYEWFPRELPAYSISLRTRTDAEGRFTFDRVPPVMMELAHAPMLSDKAPDPIDLSQTRVLDLKPGEARRADLGGEGRPIFGRVVVTNFYGALRWNNPALSLETISHGGPSDAAMVNLLGKLLAIGQTNSTSAQKAKAEQDYQTERNAFARASREFYNSLQGATNLLTTRRFLLQFNEEGEFFAQDVPPGAYHVHWLISKNTGLLVAEGDSQFTIPEGREPFDLGEIKLGKK